MNIQPVLLGAVPLTEKIYDAIIYDDRWKTLLSGLVATLQIAVVATIIGIIIGILVATVKVYAQGTKNPVLKILGLICDAYTTIIRGTPLMLQLLILYAMASFTSITACFIGFGLNSGAYVSEIFRGGINSIDPGQMEAGRSLGLSRNTTMRYIVLPQAIKNTVPSLFNEFISLIKETSVAGYVAVNELTKMASNIQSRTFTLVPYVAAALVYLTLVFGLTLVQKQIEKRYAKSDRNQTA